MLDIIKLNGKVYTITFGKHKESLRVYFSYEKVGYITEGYFEFDGGDNAYFYPFKKTYTKEQHRLKFERNHLKKKYPVEYTSGPFELAYSYHFRQNSFKIHGLRKLIYKYHDYYKDLYTAIKEISAMTQIPKIINAYDVFIKIE